MMQSGIARYAGVIDQDVRRPEPTDHFVNSGLASVEIGDVPFVDRDARGGREFPRCRVVAAVDGGDAGNLAILSAREIAAPRPLVPPVTIAMRAIIGLRKNSLFGHSDLSGDTPLAIDSSQPFWLTQALPIARGRTHA